MLRALNILLLAGAIANGNPTNYAEADTEPTGDEPTTSEVASEPTSEETKEPATSEVASESTSEEEGKGDVAEDTYDFDKFKEDVTAWLSKYLEKDLVVQIISWAVDCGVLGGLFTVYLKYRKYKSKTIGELVDEIKTKVTEQMGEDFKNLSTEQQEKLINSLESLKKSNELVIKALVLAQSKTTDSKLALLDLVAENNTSVEVKEVVADVRKEVEASQEQKDKVQEAVKSDYNPID